MGVNINLLGYRIELHGIKINLGIFLPAQVAGRNNFGIRTRQVCILGINRFVFRKNFLQINPSIGILHFFIIRRRVNIIVIKINLAGNVYS